MATRIEAEWLPELGAVRVDLINDTPSPWAVVELLRSDANSALAPVRTLTGTLPTSDELSVLDYEAAAGAVSYLARGGFEGQEASALVQVEIDRPRLGTVLTPEHTVILDLVTGYEARRTSGTTVHDVIDRPDPLASVRRLGTRRGQLVLWCSDYVTAQAVAALYDRGQTVMLRQGEFPGLDMYHLAVGDVAVLPADDGAGRRWAVELDYREVRRPLGDLLGLLGWNYGESSLRNPTYGDSSTEFPTYGDLLTGPTS